MIKCFRQVIDGRAQDVGPREPLQDIHDALAGEMRREEFFDRSLVSNLQLDVAEPFLSAKVRDVERLAE
jgi:hypothetical protein